MSRVQKLLAIAFAVAKILIILITTSKIKVLPVMKLFRNQEMYDAVKWKILHTSTWIGQPGNDMRHNIAKKNCQGYYLF